MKGYIIAGVIALAGLAAVVGVVNIANTANRAEIALTKKHENLGNVMSSGLQQLEGVAQAANMATTDLKDVFTAAIQAREGVDGSKAIMKMVTESNPNFPTSMYATIQQVVVATQKELQSEQTAFLTQKGQYEVDLGTIGRGTILRMIGYPKIDMAALTIVRRGDAVEAYKTGIAPKMDLRKAVSGN